ncbi:MAG: low molecular weight protein arginine phosphatase [Clostridia bacterium]|nr:low molecular weight protein arginine phosphatase [Clostridia bacterium]
MNVLFVCVGNTCRSPMAEAVLRKKLKERNIKTVKARSAGLSATDGKEMNPLAKAVLKENAVSFRGFRAARFNAEAEAWADVIICMTKDLAALIGGKKTTDFSALYGVKEVFDPYGGTIEDYREAFAIIDCACEMLADEISERYKKDKKSNNHAEAKK